jgi:hypothetical protein
VEAAVAAETEQIELKRFTLHHQPAGDIVYGNHREIRLVGDGAQAGEFGAVEFDHVVYVRMPVFKDFQYTGGIFGGIFDFVAA